VSPKERCSRAERREISSAEQMIEVGDRVPYFRAFAASSGREVSSRSCAGCRLVLVFHSENTAYLLKEINRAVRDRYPSTEDVVVAGVVDLSLVPPLYWLTASLIVGQIHGRSVPANDALTLQDWGGLISRRFGVQEVGRNITVIVANEHARISGLYRGLEPVGPVLRALEED